MIELSSTHPSFAMTLGTLERASALAAMTLLDGGGMRHLHNFNLVMEEVGRPSHHLPGQRRSSATGAVYVTSPVWCERPRCLTLLCERLQLVLKRKFRVSLMETKCRW